jgi:hypothetical protein
MAVEFMIPFDANGAEEARAALKRFAEATPNVGLASEAVLIGKAETFGHHFRLVGHSGRAEAAVAKFARTSIETAAFRKPESVRYSFDRHEDDQPAAPSMTR